MQLVFLDENFIFQTKQNIKNATGIWGDVAYELDKKARELMRIGPWSVTFNTSPAASENLHDYYSEGPYWWPNPENSNAPYIRKDALTNPDRFMHHESGMKAMADAVMFLSLAGFYLDRNEYIERAMYFVRVWFLDAATQMNPHMEFAQAVRGICGGRSLGIIDTIVLLRVIYAADFIRLNNRYNEDLDNLKTWFRTYLEWLNTSEKGLAEKNYWNNHANWWNTQAAALAAFVDNELILNECFDRYKNSIIPEQMDTDGSFIDEIKRDSSFHYNHFNLEACVLICEIAYQRKIDLWNYTTSENKGMERGIRFMMPYMENPFLWTHKEILGNPIHDSLCLQLGGARLNIQKCFEINKSRRQDCYFIRLAGHLGPLVLLPGWHG